MTRTRARAMPQHMPSVTTIHEVSLLAQNFVRPISRYSWLICYKKKIPPIYFFVYLIVNQFVDYYLRIYILLN